MKQVAFRKLKADEYRALIQLWQKAGLGYKPSGRDSEKSILQQLELKTNHFLVAVHNESIVGSVFAGHNYRKGWLNRLAVHPAYRNHGIASKLIELAELFFQNNGVFIFACLVEKENSFSKNLFSQKNYVEHRDIIYFTKRLKATV